MDEVIRVYSLTVSVLVIVAGTAQWRRWPTFPGPERLHWLSTVALNLTALIGTWESLRAGYPGGLRVYLLAIALTWLLAAVLHHPFVQWRTRQRDTERDQVRATFCELLGQLPDDDPALDRLRGYLQCTQPGLDPAAAAAPPAASGPTAGTAAPGGTSAPAPAARPTPTSAVPTPSTGPPVSAPPPTASRPALPTPAVPPPAPVTTDPAPERGPIGGLLCNLDLLC